MLDNEVKTDQSAQENREREPALNSFCRKCGAALGAGAKFCGACGTPVDRAFSSGQASGQELQQLADSAKAAAKAGAASARKNMAKGMEYAGEKISSAAEKMRQDKQEERVSSGEDTAGNQAQTALVSPGKLKRVWKAFTGIASVIVIVLILTNLFFRNPVGDLKDLVFDQYGSQTLGEAVKKSVPEASWDSVKLGDKHYTVTVSGFCPDMSSNIQLEFDVNYSGEYIYAKPTGLIMDGEHYDDIFSIALVMGAIYE